MEEKSLEKKINLNLVYNIQFQPINHSVNIESIKTYILDEK